MTTGCTFTSSGPVVHATVTDGLHPSPSKTEQQVGVGSETKKPWYGGITLPFFGVIGARPTEQPSPRPTGTPISLASASALVIDGVTEIISSPSVTAAPVLTINNQPVRPNSASEYIIEGQTLIPGGPAITVSGTPISLAPSASNVVVGSSTEALGPIIMGGFGPSATAGSIGSGSANSTATSSEAFTGGAGLARKTDGWTVVAVGLGMGMVMALVG